MGNKDNEAKRRPFYSWILIILMFILSLSALISGILFFIAPDGSLLWMSVDILEGSSFSDFLTPAILLFVFLGVIPLIVGLGLVNIGWKFMARLNPFRGHYWAWTGSILTGIMLLVFVVTEILMLGYYSVLQPVMGIWAVIILCLTLLPPVRRYYRVAAVPFNPKRLF